MVATLEKVSGAFFDSAGNRETGTEEVKQELEATI